MQENTIGNSRASIILYTMLNDTYPHLRHKVMLYIQSTFKTLNELRVLKGKPRAEMIRIYREDRYRVLGELDFPDEVNRFLLNVVKAKFRDEAKKARHQVMMDRDIPF